MKCPFCNKDSSKVMDSRPADDNTSIRRRRECENCGKRFTTYEKVEINPLIVIKKDNTREDYNRDKIVSGILRSCHKRSIPMEKIEIAIHEIETTIFGMGVREIPSIQIGQLVMDKLKTLDEVAYVRFASIYREFKDVENFMNELQKMRDN